MRAYAALRARLQAEGWLAEEGKADAAGERQGNKLGKASARGDATRYDKALAEAVKRFQSAHGLRPDAAVGSNTLAALNVSAAERVAQIRVNLERMRWVARDMSADRLVVDITGFNAALQLDGARVWSSKVMVGRPARETPGAARPCPASGAQSEVGGATDHSARGRHPGHDP
jgi:murein L,D-transpeptidase YcbB/YkuD